MARGVAIRFLHANRLIFTLKLVAFWALISNRHVYAVSYCRDASCRNNEFFSRSAGNDIHIRNIFGFRGSTPFPICTVTHVLFFRFDVFCLAYVVLSHGMVWEVSKRGRVGGIYDVDSWQYHRPCFFKCIVDTAKTTKIILVPISGPSLISPPQRAVGLVYLSS